MWEDDKREEGEVGQFSVPRQMMVDGGKKELRKTPNLLQDFPNLRVGGLLLDPKLNEDKVTVTTTAE